jgi:hypothetical protein
MKSVAACVLAVACASAAAQADWRAQPLIARAGDALYYRGFLNASGAARAVPLIRSGLFRTLRIESAGGDVLAGMAVGDALFEAGMDVEVVGGCVSSCANYVFTAGREKRIAEGAWVVWHGDARQWNFVEEQDAIEAKVAAKGRDALDARERWVLEHGGRMMRQQDEFYRRVGVIDGFARYGHEQEPRVWKWTFAVDTMALFGIDRVSAPADYGRASYCRRAQAQSPQPLGVQCVELEPADVAAWRNRKSEPKKTGTAGRPDS